MAVLNRVLTLVGLIVLLLSILAAVYATSQISTLSLPISRILAGFTICLPVFAYVSTSLTTRLLRTTTTRYRPLILPFLFTIQLIYESVIATLALTYFSPTANKCLLNEQWSKLYQNRDAGAIKTIQDTFDCCGFNSVADRAWPFPHGRPEEGFDARQCVRMYGRTKSCGADWAGRQRLSAGLFFGVALTVFMTKVFAIAMQSNLWNQYFDTAADGGRGEYGRQGALRHLIAGGEENGDQGAYHDEEEGTRRVENGTAEEVNGNESGLRVEPSGLNGNDASAQWRESS